MSNQIKLKMGLPSNPLILDMKSSGSDYYLVIKILCYISDRVLSSCDSPARSPSVSLADIQKVKKLTLLCYSVDNLEDQVP